MFSFGRRWTENGAQKRTRTSTPLRAPAPEAGASTNSAIWARGRPRELGSRPRACQRSARACQARERAGKEAPRSEKARSHDGKDGPARHPVRRRRLHRPLCRPGPVQGRRAGPHRRARAAPRLLPEAARRARPDPVRPRRHHRPGAGRRRRRTAPTRWSTWSASSRAISRRSMSRAPATSPRRRPRPACRRWSTSRRSAPIPESESAYGRTKGEGEAGGPRRLPGRDHHPPVDRVRAGGRFRQPLRRMARLLPVAAGDPRRVEAAAGLCRRSRQGDRARPRSIRAPHAGKTYELGGPQVMTMARAQRLDLPGDRPQPSRSSRSPIRSAG